MVFSAMTRGVCALCVAPEASPAAGLRLCSLELGHLSLPLCRPFSQHSSLANPPINTVCSAYCRDKDILAKGTSDNGIVGQIGELSCCLTRTRGHWIRQGTPIGSSVKAALEPGQATRKFTCICFLLAMSELPFLSPEGARGPHISRGSQSSLEEGSVTGTEARHSLGVLHVSFSVR